MITALEEFSLNAWAALQTVHYDGWVLRFANGYTKRANSINPIHASSIPLDEKIRFCEEIYKSRQLPVVFKLNPHVYPEMLDEELSARGFQKSPSSTSVQTLKLDFSDFHLPLQTELEESLSSAWLNAVCHMNGVAEENRETLRQILLNVVPHHCFLSLKFDDRIVACGMGVLQSEFLGLFDIFTDPAFRNRGYGRQVVEGLLAWGQQNQAKQAYLQVELHNTVALHLYSSLGFKEQYQYWYRSKP